MRTQGKQEMAEGVLIGVLVAALSEVSAWLIGNAFRRRQAMETARKKKGK